MKRMALTLCAAVLMVALAATGCLALAEGTDLGSMSLEALIALREDISREIVRRLSKEDNALIPGEYLVGRDIAAGGYTVTCLKGERAQRAAVVNQAVDGLGKLFGVDIAETATQVADNLTPASMLLGIFSPGKDYESGRNTEAPEEAFTAYADTAFTLAEGESIVLNLKEGEYLIVRRGQGMCVPFMAAYSEAVGQ